MKNWCMSGNGFLAPGLFVAVVILSRRESFTISLFVEESAGSEPKDWTELARWPPMVDGAAGDDDKKVLGESTEPKAIGPVNGQQSSEAL